MELNLFFFSFEMNNKRAKEVVFNDGCAIFTMFVLSRIKRGQRILKYFFSVFNLCEIFLAVPAAGTGSESCLYLQ